MRWILAVPFLVLALGNLTRAEPADHPDKRVTHYFDLASYGESDAYLTLSLPEKVWQHGDHPPGWAPGTAVRKGWGAAWWYVDDPSKPGTAAHAYLEIEPLEGGTLRIAAANALKNLGAVCEASKFTLLDAPGAPELYETLTLGGEKVGAYTASYSVSHKQTRYKSRALFFAVRDHLVTLTVDSRGETDHFETFVKGLGRAKARSAGPWYFKLFFADAGVSRFLALSVPHGLTRNYKFVEGNPSATWERRDKDGRVVSRFTVTETWSHRQSLEVYLTRRMESYRALYKDLSGPTEVELRNRSAWEIGFSEPKRRGTRHVRLVFVRLENQDYTLMWETIGDDGTRVDADRKMFDRILAGTRIWKSN